jgi:single-strand DNA-binding protein
MNNITIAGNLVKDIEVRMLTDGKNVGNFTIADNQSKEKPPIFWPCSLFGDRVTILAQYLKKGTAVAVSGSVTLQEYKDKNGITQKVYGIRVQDLALQGLKSKDTNSNQIPF